MTRIMETPRRWSLAVGVWLTVTAFFVVSSAAHAVQDYSSLTDGFAAELAAALPIGLAAVGLFIGVLLAYKVVRRVLRA